MSEQKNWQWLAGQLPSWIEKGIIGQEQADGILQERPLFQEKQNLLTRILISISALLFGLGVISFFAYNWAEMPKWLKLATIFISFITAHIAGIIIDKDPKMKNLSEFFHLLGTFFFGAAIILIAQVYHIDEHAPNGIFLWSLGALMMMYILNSTPQMILFAVLTVIWQTMEARYDTQQTWAVFYAVAAALPLAFYKKHVLSTAIATATVLIVTLTQLEFYEVNPVSLILCLGVLGIGIGLLIRRTAFQACALPLEIAGYILYFCTLIALTFPEVTKEVMTYSLTGNESKSFLFPVLISSITLVVWGLCSLPLKTFLKRFNTLESRQVFCVFAVYVLTLALTIAAHTELSKELKVDASFAGMCVFNLFALIHGIILIFSGTRSGRTGVSFIGCLVVISVIIARFLSCTDNLLIRSLCFILAGAFMLFIAVKTSKVKQQIDQNV